MGTGVNSGGGVKGIPMLLNGTLATSRIASSLPDRPAKPTMFSKPSLEWQARRKVGRLAIGELWKVREVISGVNVSGRHADSERPGALRRAGSEEEAY